MFSAATKQSAFPYRLFSAHQSVITTGASSKPLLLFLSSAMNRFVLDILPWNACLLIIPNFLLIAASMQATNFIPCLFKPEERMMRNASSPTGSDE